MYIQPFIYLMTTFGSHSPTAVPSSAPVSLQGSAVNSTTIQLQWEPPPLSDQNGVIRSYIINISVAETGSSFQLTSETSTLYISNLHPYYIYTLTVAAVTIGPGPYGQVLTVKMSEDGMDCSLTTSFLLCIDLTVTLFHIVPLQFQAVHQYTSKALQLTQQPSNSSGNHLHYLTRME